MSTEFHTSDYLLQMFLCNARDNFVSRLHDYNGESTLKRVKMFIRNGVLLQTGVIYVRSITCASATGTCACPVIIQMRWSLIITSSVTSATRDMRWTSLYRAIWSQLCIVGSAARGE